MSFLSPLLTNPDRVWMLANVDSGRVLARRVHAALDSKSRRQGLLGREGLDDEALIIAPCNAVHTLFMRFAIDVVFVDRQGRIARCVPAVKPWRITGAFRAFATIELPSGTIGSSQTQRGQRLELVVRPSA